MFGKVIIILGPLTLNL